jgi:hypothetical protein
MFENYFKRIKNFNKLLIEHYVRILYNHTYKLIVTYALLNILFTICLTKFYFTTNTERLTFVRDSESFKLANEINELFIFKPNVSQFSHRLTDFGYYVDIIIKSKIENETNLIDKKFLNEYNWFFSQLQNISFEYNNQTYVYENLCSRRFDKCAIEGKFRDFSYSNPRLRHNYIFSFPRWRISTSKISV